VVNSGPMEYLRRAEGPQDSLRPLETSQSLRILVNTLTNILQVVRPIRMNFVASLPVPRYLFVRFLAPALAPLSEASGVSSASLRGRSRLGVIECEGPSPTGFVQCGFIQHLDTTCSQSRLSPRGETSTRNQTRFPGVSIPCDTGSASGPQVGPVGDPQRRLVGSGSLHVLMMTGLDRTLLVRASAIKLSEERLRQARNQGNRVQGLLLSCSYPYPGVLFAQPRKGNRKSYINQYARKNRG
jgi:hypothetical protein